MLTATSFPTKIRTEWCQYVLVAGSVLSVSGSHDSGLPDAFDRIEAVEGVVARDGVPVRRDVHRSASMGQIKVAIRRQSARPFSASGALATRSNLESHDRPTNAGSSGGA